MLMPHFAAYKSKWDNKGENVARAEEQYSDRL